MTVTSDTKRVQYSGDNNSTAFSVPFYFLEKGHLRVILTSAAGADTVQTITTDYTVSGEGDTSGGTVTMNIAPAAGEKLTIIRDVPLTQEVDYVENDPFPADTHERALDKLTMIVQQFDEEIERTLKAPTTSDITDGEIPSVTANYVLRVNSAGDGFEAVKPIDAALQTALTPTDGNFIVGDGSDWVVESGATARSSLGLGSMATQNSGSVTITGGSISGITDLAIADGGTGASTAAGARTNLGLEIGTDVQANDAGLTSIAGLTTSANKMLYTTAADTYAVADLTPFARSILDDVDEATFKATVNLEIGTDVQAYSPSLSDLVSNWTVASSSSQSSLVFDEDTDNGTNTVTLQPAASLSASYVVTLPSGTTTLVGIDTTDTLTNKTIDASNNTLSNIAPSMASVTGADSAFVSGTAGTSGNLVSWDASGDAVDGPTPPNGDIVGTTDTQTLTNKTLTSPTINGADASGGTVTLGTISGAIDAGGATSLEIPNNTSVTTNAAGEIALDTDGNGSTITTGVIQVHDGTQNTYVVSTTNFPSSDNDVPAYDASTNSVVWQPQSGTGGGGLTDVVDDTTPQLGGNLDVNGNKIVSTSNGNIDIEPNGTGNVILGNFTLDADQTINLSNDDHILTYDHSSGLVSLEALDISVDTSPQLGGNLNTQGNYLTSPSSVDRMRIVNTSIEFEITGNQKLDITSGGMRLNGANARVDSILDEDDMASDSATALATQQSIKAYVDSQSGGGGMTLLATATASNSATVEFTSVIDSTYDHYELHIIAADVASDSGLCMRTSTSNGLTWDSTTGNYSNSLFEISSAGTTAAEGGAQNYDRIILTRAVGPTSGINNDEDDAFSGIIQIFRPASTAVGADFLWTGRFRDKAGGNQLITVIGSAQRGGVSDVDAIQIYAELGNIESGEFKLYGIKKS